MQTYGVVNELLQFHSLTHGLIMGGCNRATEVQKLSKGVNVLIATPGRLLDHMQVCRIFFQLLHSTRASRCFSEYARIHL